MHIKPVVGKTCKKQVANEGYGARSFKTMPHELTLPEIAIVTSAVLLASYVVLAFILGNDR